MRHAAIAYYSAFFHRAYCPGKTQLNALLTRGLDLGRNAGYRQALKERVAFNGVVTRAGAALTEKTEALLGI